MKKLSAFTIVVFIMLCSTLTGCKNFFAGGSFMEELDQSIIDVNAPSVDIYIEADANSGSVSPSGKVSYKLGRTFSVIFKESKEYKFIKWEVVDKETKNSMDDVLELLETKENESKFKILANKPNILLHAVSYERPKVDEYSPKYADNGVSRDSSIVLTFNKNLSEDNDFSDISITSNGVSVKDCFKEPVLNNNIITIAAAPENLIDATNGLKSVTVTVPTGIYFTKDSEDVSLAEDFSWTFKVNNSTDNKAEITFSVADDNGVITPNGTQKYSIGETVELNYSVTAGYNFKGWTILDSDGKDILGTTFKLANPESANTSFVVPGALKGVSISPKSVLIPACTSVSPAENSTGISVPQDSNIIISFNTPVQLSDFYDETTNSFKNISISSDNESLISGTTVDLRHYYFNKPVLSSDKKTLTIETNKEHTVLPVPSNGSSASVTKNINVSIKLTNVVAKEVNSAFQSDLSWFYIINNTVDSQPPRLESISFYKDSNLTQPINLEAFEDSWDSTKLLNHHVSTIYVKVNGYDAGGGVKALCFTEKPLRNTSGDDISNTSVETSLQYVTKDINNSKFKNSGNGYYEAVVPAQLTSGNDGIVRVKFCISDYAGNLSEYRSIEVLKDTTIEKLDICPPEEGHTLGKLVESSFTDSNNSNNKINKYRTIDNSFIRSFNLTNDVVSIKASGLCEKTKPYLNYNSSIVVTDLLWGYSTDEQYMSSASYDEVNQVFTFTRDKNKTTYIKYIAHDAAGNNLDLLRAIPKSVTIISAKNEKSGFSRTLLADDTAMNLIVTDNDKEQKLLSNNYGFYTLYRYGNESEFRISQNTVSFNNIHSSLTALMNGYYENIVPFTFNPSAGAYNGSNVSIKNPNIPTGGESDFKDFRKPGNYSVYILPYVKYDERIYFGALSNPIVFDIQYDSVNSKNKCSVIVGSEVSINDNDLPEDIEVVSEKGPLSSGIYNITIKYPGNFIKNTELQYYIRVRVNSNNTSSTTYYFNSDSFSLNTGNDYYIALVARDINGNEKIKAYTNNEKITCKEDNIPPNMTSAGSMSYYKNAVRMFKMTAQGADFYNPRDASGLLVDETSGYTELLYCFKKFESNQSSATTYSVEDLISENKLSVKYNPKTFEYVTFPFTNYLEDGLYTMCLQMEDKNHNKGVFCFEVSTLPAAAEKSYIISYSDANSTDNITFKMDMNGMYGTQNHIIEYVDKSDSKWKLYLVDSNKKYSFNDGNGGNASSSSKTVKFSELGDSSGETFVRVNANYVGRNDSNHLHHFPTKYILPAYVKTPANYPCKVKSYVKTDSGTNEIIVFSDTSTPVLVQTVYSNINLDNVSTTDKNEEIWAQKAIEVSTSIKQDKGSFTYSIPVNSPEIPAGYWYTALCYYPDGSILMTSPKQK